MLGHFGPRRVATLRSLLLAALGTTFAHAQTPVVSMPAGTNVVLGRVIEVGTDAPVGGAIVSLTGHFNAAGKPAAPALGVRATELPPVVNVMTTADGYFVFRNLPAGTFTAAIRALGYVNSDFPPTLVEVRENQKPTEVQFRVWKFAAIGGRVVDERGEPVAGVLVNALRRAPAGGGVLNPSGAGPALTDDRGEYRITQLPPGEYTAGIFSTTTTLPESVAAALDPSVVNRDNYMAMTAELRQSGFFRTWGCPTCISNSHEGHHVAGFVLQRPGVPLPPAPDGRPLGFANTYYPGTTRAADATTVSLGSGESRTDLDLVLRLTPTVTVSGVLTGPDGPMAHAMLTLAPPGTDRGDFEMTGMASAVTDSRGAFAFLAVAPGEYALSALALLGNEMTGEGKPVWASQSLNVGDTGVTGLTITMQPGVRASGRMEFKSTSGTASQPTQRQVFSLQPVRAQFWRTLSAVVQSDGRFETAGDPPGRYILNALTPAGWFLQTTTLAGKPVLDEMIELGASEVSGLVFTFGQTTNRVSGRVSDNSGAPDPDAAIIVFPADSNAWREGIFTSRRARKVLATSAGSYELATFAPGEYYVAAVAARQALTWQDPQFLERLIAGATKVTLGAEDQKTVPLRTLTLTGRER